jgi:hypothetical protein
MRSRRRATSHAPGARNRHYVAFHSLTRAAAAGPARSIYQTASKFHSAAPAHRTSIHRPRGHRLLNQAVALRRVLRPVFQEDLPKDSLKELLKELPTDRVPAPRRVPE